MTHEELRALALAATPGPWSFAEIDPLDKEWGACEIIEGDGAFVSTHVDGKENAAYITAASPDVVLGLLDDNERLNADLVKHRDLLITHLSVIDPLRDENERLRSQCAELEKDALRYRQIKKTTKGDFDKMVKLAGMPYAHGGIPLGESLDAAMKEQSCKT